MPSIRREIGRPVPGLSPARTAARLPPGARPARGAHPGHRGLAIPGLTGAARSARPKGGPVPAGAGPSGQGMGSSRASTSPSRPTRQRAATNCAWACTAWPATRECGSSTGRMGWQRGGWRWCRRSEIRAGCREALGQAASQRRGRRAKRVHICSRTALPAPQAQQPGTEHLHGVTGLIRAW